VTILQFAAPPGWTTNPASPVYYEEWEGPESKGQRITRYYDLEPGRPIMEDDKAWKSIFQSGDRFYLWERIGYDVCETASRDIREIVRIISQTGLRELVREPH
jgi:hypothetical protein